MRYAKQFHRTLSYLGAIILIILVFQRKYDSMDFRINCRSSTGADSHTGKISPMLLARNTISASSIGMVYCPLFSLVPGSNMDSIICDNNCKWLHTSVFQRLKSTANSVKFNVP